MSRTGIAGGLLSDRERQLLALASRGFTDHAIANHLGISLATVGTYWGRVRIKFGPLNRTELVANFISAQATANLDELKAENVRLKDALQQKSQDEEELRSSIDLLQALVEMTPDAMLVVSGAGEITLANEVACEMFGYEGVELVGKALDLLLPERYRVKHVGNRREYAERPIKRQMAVHLPVFGLRKDGVEFPAVTALNGVQTPSGLMITCIVRDLTRQLEDLSQPEAKP
jgi:PAS domain S-box-containing protein